jgi:hypothetical protein
MYVVTVTLFFLSSIIVYGVGKLMRERVFVVEESPVRLQPWKVIAFLLFLPTSIGGVFFFLPRLENDFTGY